MPLEGRYLAIQGLDDRVTEAWKRGRFEEAQELNRTLDKYESMTDEEFEKLKQEDHV